MGKKQATVTLLTLKLSTLVGKNEMTSIKIVKTTLFRKTRDKWILDPYMSSTLNVDLKDDIKGMLEDKKFQV